MIGAEGGGRPAQSFFSANDTAGRPRSRTVTRVLVGPSRVRTASPRDHLIVAVAPSGETAPVASET